MSDRFTAAQPKDGDTVLHCGHLENKPHRAVADSRWRRKDLFMQDAEEIGNTCATLKAIHPQPMLTTSI